MLNIPLAVEHQILLNGSLKVLHFLHFPIPGITTETVHAIESYLSKDKPNITIPAQVTHVEAPPKGVAIALQPLLKNDTNIQSIVCSHDSLNCDERYPLWITNYWVKLEAIWEAQNEWRVAVEAINKRVTLGPSVAETWL
ncbi:hypothetical protein K435DRAFT_860185 [Dendrothele bispora CBS 962.96]|uniref:Uncharacterized protein n=1 Tax=Dendrothele bispora (strain CBS 962.96) TaxID=1314807 RepID=A0A4S8LZR7_DENBC|nr:hypothetical protein K435DRAFT_860185 [Dendrothele bispora CBS 962.96]